MKELVTIQNRLNAPKGRTNDFGHYKYRSCEDILTAVKPLLKETECTITLSDEMVLVGNRIYVKATAMLTNGNGEKEITTAYAREEETKKGMDAAQVTGSASSYARKYALNGLLAIDDTKDADALNDGKQGTKPKPQAQANTTAVQANTSAAQAQGSGDLTPGELFEFYAKPAIIQATTKKELKKIYDDMTALSGYEPFMSALSARKKEVRQ